MKLKKILILLLSLCLITGCTTGIAAPKNYEKQVSINEVINDNKQLYVFIKNNQSDEVDVELDIIYYDSSNEELDYDLDYVTAIKENQESIIIFDLPDDYAYYEMSKIITKSENASQVSSLDIKTEDTKKNILLTLTNTGTDTISTINGYIIYYKDDKPIDYDLFVKSKLESNASVTENMLYPEDTDGNNLAYDNYQIIISEAY